MISFFSTAESQFTSLIFNYHQHWVSTVCTGLVTQCNATGVTHCNDTVCTGIESSDPTVNSFATAVTQIRRSRLSSRVEMGLELSVSGIYNN